MAGLDRAFGRWRIGKAAAIVAAAALAAQPVASLGAASAVEMGNGAYQPVGAEASNQAQDGAGEAIEGETPIWQVTGLWEKEYSDSEVCIAWEALPDADGYEVCRYDNAAGEYLLEQAVEGAKSNQYADTGLDPGATYSYRVRAYRRDSQGAAFYGSYSEPLSATTAPKPPTGLYIKFRELHKVALGWKEVEGVSGYRIYRRDFETNKYQKVKTVRDPKELVWVNPELQPAHKYAYVVKAFVKTETGTYFSQRSEEITAKTRPGRVEGLTASAEGKGKIRLTWEKFPGADGYRIYRKVKENGTSYDKKIKTIGDGDATTWVDSGLASNTAYVYTVCAYIEDDNTKRYDGYGSDKAKARTNK